jgi:hypothetical protein
MEPCPNCDSSYLGMDVIYAQGACRFCQECGMQGPRVAVSIETLHADQLALATSAWNEWAESEQLSKLTLPEGGYINDTRFSG